MGRRIVGLKSLLLDTCALVWLAIGSELSAPAQVQIERASEAGTLYLSPITAWEITTLVRKGRISFGQSAGDFVRAAFLRPGIRVAAVTPEIACAAGEFPDSFTGDPADRLLAATAVALGLSVVTRDRRILDYAATGALAALPC